MSADDLQEITRDKPSIRKQVMSKLSGVKSLFGKLAKKAKLTDRQLNRLVEWCEYIMFGFITVAVLAIVAFGIHFALVGFAIPVTIYLQVVVGSTFSAMGMFILQVILEGGASYLSSRMRNR